MRRIFGHRALVLLRLLALVVLASVLTLNSASASDVRPESCPYGATSALGPVDAQGNGDTTPETRCLQGDRSVGSEPEG